jgi:hypothetical protein
MPGRLSEVHAAAIAPLISWLGNARTEWTPAEPVNGWELEREVDIPQWAAICDHMSIYRRHR